MVSRYNPEIHHRRSIRLQGYDYTQANAYFITICVQNRECLFGEIKDEEMQMNEYGRIVRDEWLKTAEIRQGIELGAFVVMPNHFHGILSMHDLDGGHRTGTARRAPTACRAPTIGRAHTIDRAPTMEQFGKPVAGSLPTIMRSFKSAVTKWINEIRNSPGVSIWQRNYYEHIIRNEEDYNRIAEYIAHNPRQWKKDTLHPDNQSGNIDSRHNKTVDVDTSDNRHADMDASGHHHADSVTADVGPRVVGSRHVVGTRRVGARRAVPVRWPQGDRDE